MSDLRRYDPFFSFSESLAAYPDRNALFIQNKHYKYAELANIVHFIYTLIPLAKRYERIGVYCNDDVYTYAGILAINLHGAAYVPLNNKNPAGRNKKIIEACKLELILSSSQENDLETQVPVISTLPAQNRTWQKISERQLGEICSIARNEYAPEQTAYILFTSGSTGEPKGVPVSIGSVNAFFKWFRENYDLNEEDKFLQVYELSFDVSVFSFFMPLMCGACCYVLPQEGIKPMKIVDEIRKHEITVCSMVPSVLEYLEKYMEEISLPSLRYSFFSGDALYHKPAAKWTHCIPNGVIHNFYGPTETTIVCSRYVFDEQRSEKESENGIVPLGKLFRGMEFMRLDENKAPSEKGELCLCGTQVIRNYLNNEDEDKFINIGAKRFYRTGDIVSVNANGDLLFYGRTDNQVKINGYRVELAEVEAAVSRITGHRSIGVFVRKEQRLYVFMDTETADTKSILKKLSGILPFHMIPYKLIPVREWPMNMNGKVDRPKLLNIYL